MPRHSIVTAPDGTRWRVSRRWMDRPLPNPRRRFQANRSENAEELAYSGLEAASGLDFLDSPGVAIAIAVASLAIFVLLLPAIGVALELIVALAAIWAGIAGRLLLGRPWIVQAVNLDDPNRSAAFAVRGWRRSGRAIGEIAANIAAAGPPDRISAGVPIGSRARANR